MQFLEVKDISKKKDDEHVLESISFIQKQFQNIAIAGETGSGKSSLLKIIAGLMQADHGDVFFNEEQIVGPDEKLIPGHPGIAYLSQHFELRNNYRVEEILEMANQLPGQEADVIYDVCQIQHLLKRRTDQLSGGEKQRIAAARLLTSSPKLLLLDEPFSNLDLAHKNTMKKVIHDIGEKLQISCILVSHDPADSLSWADEMIVLRAGKIVQQGTPTALYHQPIDEYTGALLGEYQILSTEATETLLGSAIAKKEKRVFLRPEYFSITSNHPGCVKGNIIDKRFFGSFYKLNVLAGKQTLTVHSLEHGHKAGDIIFLQYNQDKLWYI